jgi:hypothetical protein
VKRLLDVVGPSFTKEIFYTARQFSAEEAKTMGLINRVVPDAELESYVKKYAETIAGNAPLTIKALKTWSANCSRTSRSATCGARAIVNACFRSKDYIEGRDAFMEKRKPVFTGSLSMTARPRRDAEPPQRMSRRRIFCSSAALAREHCRSACSRPKSRCASCPSRPACAACR